MDTNGVIATTSGAAMIWRNQNDKAIFNLDENGNFAVTGDVSAKNVNAEKATILNGVEMKDTATGLMYCLRITNGQIVSTSGSCSNQLFISQPNSSQVSNSFIITPVVTPSPTPSIQTESTPDFTTTVVESTTTPEVIPVPPPIPTPVSEPSPESASNTHEI